MESATSDVEMGMAHKRGSAMGNPLSLEDLIEQTLLELQRQQHDIFRTVMMRFAQQLSQRVGEEAHRKAQADVRSRLESVFGPGALGSDFALTGSFMSPVSRQLIPVSSTPVHDKPAKRGKASAATAPATDSDKPSRKGQKWQAACPVPGCHEKAIRSKMNFCAGHAAQLDPAMKKKLRDEQKIRQVSSASA